MTSTHTDPDFLTFHAGKSDFDGFTTAALIAKHAASHTPIRVARIAYDHDRLRSLANEVAQARRDAANGVKNGQATGKAYGIGKAANDQVQERVKDGFTADELGALGEVLMREALGDNARDWSELVSDEADKVPDFHLDGRSFDIKTTGYSNHNGCVRHDRVGAAHYQSLLIVKLLQPGVADVFVIENERRAPAWSELQRSRSEQSGKALKGDTPYYLINLPWQLQKEWKQTVADYYAALLPRAA